MKLDRLQTAVFAGALALAAWPALKPEPKTDFNLAAFARVPVLEGGRVKPLDSFARNTMLAMRSKQSVPVDGKALPPARWLLDAAFKPELADTYAAFVVDDPEVLGLVRLDQGKTRYFAYWQLEPSRDEIQKQAALADEIAAPQRTRFQSAVLSLHGRLAMYERLKNTFMISGSGDPVLELAAFSSLLPSALKAFHSKKQTAADLRAMKALSDMLQRYNFIAQTAAFKAIPPKEGADADAWTNAGEAVVSPSGGEPHPSLASFAIMGRAYRAGDAAAFNAALSEHTTWLAQYRPAAARAARSEALFNKISPFTTGMALYILALLLIFAGWATRRPEVDSAARALAWAGFAVHTAGLFAHSVLQGRPPVTNLYSSAVFVGWAAVALGLFAERFHKRGFSAAGACVIGFTTLIVAHHLKSSGDTMEMMRAVLDSNFWLATHVVTITIGYSSTYLAGMLGIAWVVRRHLPLKPDPAASKALSELAYGVIAFSLFFSFIGTVLGGIWADQSWGRFWGWDPKENGALLIVLWNAFILHARWGGYARERGIMLMAIFGNIIVSLSWFGVNMLGIGLHSYGFMDKAFLWLSAFCALQLALMLLGAMPPRFWTERADA
ncbi:MAG: cytochrome c biogenesis protein CcsA [Elusimicrobiota bacterium]|nr:cytochrome c biogenesis protein CcsA [Elusimicrobiota bacterium]